MICPQVNNWRIRNKIVPRYTNVDRLKEAAHEKLEPSTRWCSLRGMMNG